jgi:hypothetical protein
MTRITKDTDGSVRVEEFGNFKFVPMLPDTR